MWTEGLIKIVGDRDDTTGKYVLAAVDIPAGTLVLKETPLIEGPKQSSSLVCVGCCSVMEKCAQCEWCGLPLCQKCCNISSLHSEECKLFQENKMRFIIESEKDQIKYYSIVTILRALLSGKVEEFESHQKRRDGTPIWLYVESTVVPVLVNLKRENKIMFTSEMIHAAAGVLDTNTFELKIIQDDQVTRIGRGLYQHASMLNNNCQPTCRKQFNWNEISVYTCRHVSAGEELSICYTGLLQPTHIRQTVFQQTKHFKCLCVRCQDPTELKTHLGSIKCPECGDIADPINNQWKCDQGCLTNQEDGLNLFERCETLVSKLTASTDPMIWMSLGRKLSNMLPQHNYILTKYKEKLLQNAKSSLPEEQILQYTKDLNWIKGVLESNPGKQVTSNNSLNDTKIIYGKDIVKQLMASKLSSHIENQTLSKLTE